MKQSYFASRIFKIREIIKISQIVNISPICVPKKPLRPETSGLRLCERQKYRVVVSRQDAKPQRKFKLNCSCSN